MRKVEIFRNELRNYLGYKELLDNYRSMYNTQLKLKGEDTITERFEILKIFNKALVPMNNNLIGTWTKMVGVGAIRYDIEPGSYNESLSEEKKLELVDLWNLQLIEFISTLNEAETKLKKEIDRLQQNINHIESVIYQLPTELKNACIEIYCEKQTFTSKSNELAYTDAGLFKKIEKEIEKII